MAENEKWYSIKEISEYLGVSRETILNWIEKRNMPAIKAGRLWKFKRSVVDEWLKCGGATPIFSLTILQYDSMPSIAKKFVESQLTKQTISIATLKFVLGIIISGIAEQVDKIDFSAKDQEEMTNDAVCSILASWLIEATNTHQAPYKFTQEQHPLWHHDDDEFKQYKSGIERGVEAYYQRYFDINSTKSIDEQKSNPHLIALYFAAFYYDDGSREGLSLFRDLYNRKKEAQVIGKTKRNVIVDGYKQYFQLVQSINNETDDTAYVAKVLTFVQYEWLHRFLLAYQVFNALDNCTEIDFPRLSVGLSNYYHRITTKEKIIDFSSLRFGDQILSKICSKQFTNVDNQKIYWSRIIIQVAMDTLLNWMPEDYLRSEWAKETFEEAAKFFRDDYKFDRITATINQTNNLDNYDDDRINTLKEIIINMYDPDLLKTIRDYIRTTNKNKNQRSRQDGSSESSQKR